MIGISVNDRIGIGDGLQFSSLPENYFRANGKKLIDLNKKWFFDFNPFVIRDTTEKPEKTLELWNFSPTQYEWPNPRTADQPRVYLSNAEIHASIFNIKPALIRPRLYKFEDYPFHKRELILLHVDGKSHGDLPEEIIQHVLKKYGGTGKLFQIGKSEINYGIPKLETPTIWDLVETISTARILIGPDSGPSWIAACYPDIITKIVRLKPSPEYFKTWVPLDIHNIHSHWDDRCRQVYNPTTEDIGFTQSYRKI